jgi:hypothetical protein
MRRYMESYQDSRPRSPSSEYHGHYLRAALAYASREIPVFPCTPGGKTPLTPHGFKDATTDPDVIWRLWTKHPKANIAIPTGRASGIFILDADIKHGGLEALGTLPDLPATTRVRTGGGGVHIYLRYPEGQKITNSPGDLPPGLDVRGEGGYVLAPPSVTKAAYVTEVKLPHADAPAWLLERIGKRRAVAGDAPYAGSGAKVEARVESGSDLAGEVIGDGRRNHTLTSIGGRLRAEGKSREEIEATLLDVNASRCAPPLPVEEVISVAASVSRYAAGNLKPAPDAETLAVISNIERRLWSRSWPGMGGKTERDIMICLIDLARRYAQLVEDGPEISVGVRALALAAAVSKKSCRKALGRLYDQGEARRGSAGSGNASGTIILLGRARVTHSTTERVVSKKKMVCGLPLRAPRLRWSSPAYQGRRGLVKGTFKVRQGPKPPLRDAVLRLGKTCGAVVDALEKFGLALDLAELAEILGVKRPRDLRRRVIPRLVDAGVITFEGDRASLTGDWLDALNRERELSGEIALFEKQMHQNNAESEKDRARRRERERRRASGETADGYIEELRPVDAEGRDETPAPRTAPPVSPLAVVIREYLDCNPNDACQPPGWIGSTLWAFDLITGKATLAEVREALEELGGEVYQRELLERARAAG